MMRGRRILLFLNLLNGELVHGGKRPVRRAQRNPSLLAVRQQAPGFAP